MEATKLDTPADVRAESSAQGRRATAEELKYAFRHHPAGVALVTADIGDGPVAMTVSSISSVTLSPPTIVFSASSASSSTPTLRRASTVVVHLLTTADLELAKLGARSGADRFGPHVAWGRLPSGEPYYPAVSSWLRCEVIEHVDLHGSLLFVLEAIEASPQGGQSETVRQPLVYHDRKWHALGGRSVLPEIGAAVANTLRRDE
ncbi:MAG TPA: flavin reductase family protein [Microbacteriaceae bacterium]|nr:flavin reductase family protein [Microbacteriaceae bacterium]